MTSSRRRRVAVTSSDPVTASAAPGTRRTSRSSSAGRNSALEGMHAQKEHSPPINRSSTSTTSSPFSPRRPAHLAGRAGADNDYVALRLDVHRSSHRTLPGMRDVEIRGEMIRLGQLLKLAGVVPLGRRRARDARVGRRARQRRARDPARAPTAPRRRRRDRRRGAADRLRLAECPRMAAYDVSGRTALITGAARGIGLATAKALAARGANVALLDLDAESARQAAAEVHDTRAMGLGADVTDRGAMQRAVAEVVERFGGLDIVIANAGITSMGATYRATATETFDRVLEVNLHGVERTVAAALPQIVERGGHVVVIASVYAFMNGAGQSAYAMSKAAVEAFGRALRVELRPHGASASVAYFGFIDTEMVRRALDADPLAGTFKARIPKLLAKRVQPSVAGEAIAAGIEKRAPRIIRPRRWTVLSWSRGWFMPLSDVAMERDPGTLEITRELDSRGDQEQPTTA